MVNRTLFVRSQHTENESLLRKNSPLIICFWFVRRASECELAHLSLPLCDPGMFMYDERPVSVHSDKFNLHLQLGEMRGGLLCGRTNCCLGICVHVCASVCRSVCVFARLSFCQYKHFSEYLMHMFICVCLSVCDNRMSAKTQELMRPFLPPGVD